MSELKPSESYDERISPEQKTYTKEDERRATLKFDMLVVPLVTMFYILSSLDRANIGSARAGGMQTDLGISDRQYLIALTVTLVPYIAIELPSNLLLKRIGPQVMMPTMVVFWGIVTTLQGLIHNYSGLLACRFFLGLCTGELLPGSILYLASFYKRHQLQLRVALLISATSLAGAFAGLLAIAIMKMDGVGGKPGWAWLFIIEGLLTVVSGAGCFLVMPSSPATVSLLTPSERLAVMNMLKEDWGDEDQPDVFQWSDVVAGFTSPHVLILCIGLFFSGTCVFGLASFQASIINALGHSAVDSQLLGVPCYFISFLMSVVFSFLSDKYQKRGLVTILFAAIAAVGYIIYLASTNRRVLYGSLFFQIVGAYGTAPSLTAWIPNNVLPHYKRATAIAMGLVMSHAGGILSIWIFQDPPRFAVGTRIQLSFAIGMIVIALANMAFLKRENEKRQDMVERGTVPHEIDTEEGKRRLGDLHPRFTYTL